MIELGMTAQASAAPGGAARPGPCAMVIFGASGDLSRRKLLPALGALARDGLLPRRFALAGFGRSAVDLGELAAPLENGAGGGDPGARLARSMLYVRGDYGDPSAYRELAAELDALDARQGTGGNRLFYLAVPPSVFPKVLQGLKGAGLVYDPEDGRWSRVVVEKPFGRDLASARELNLLTRSILDESQIYRIDHYLGKETVQNLLVFRFANAIFEPLWNRRHVDHIQITFAESIGVEGRGSFYEEAGVVRDIVQNHLLQVLSLVAMEPPLSNDADNIRDQKALVFRALRPMDPVAARREAVMGQYRNYQEEKGVAPGSKTPTFAAMRVFLDNWRWQGTPIYLRAGKALPRRVTEVLIQFQRVPVCVFSREQCQRIQPNVLSLRIQPEEGIALRFGLKQPGEPPTIVPAHLDFRYKSAFGGGAPDAYVRLLLDAMRGDQTLFIRSDEVEACWAFCDPVLQAFESADGPGPETYEPGAWGPASAEELLCRDGRQWLVSE